MGACAGMRYAERLRYYGLLVVSSDSTTFWFGLSAGWVLGDAEYEGLDVLYRADSEYGLAPKFHDSAWIEF